MEAVLIGIYYVDIILTFRYRVRKLTFHPKLTHQGIFIYLLILL